MMVIKLSYAKIQPATMNTPTSLLALLKCAFSPPILVDALKTALVVGLFLNLINNGQALYEGINIHWGSVLLDFCVPFCVAAYSGARAASGELATGKFGSE